MTLEFSKTIGIHEIPDRGKTVMLAPSAEECRLIALRANLPALHELRADLQIQFLPQSDIIQITGHCVAKITQLCIVSLDQFDSEHIFEFTCSCMESAKADEINAKLNEGLDDAAEGFEPIIDDRIDIGELVVQEFILSLDPYPRKPGAESDLDAVNRQYGDNNPFDVLKLLKNK